MHWYEDGTFRFAVGVEDTFIPQTRFGERPLDEYAMTQHYHFWHEDLGLVAESGASMVRWGIPWYRVNPAPGEWDWSWLDRVVDRFAELGTVPIVDLMHYGTPLWLDNEFANASYPERVAEYAVAVAERYRGVLDVFTPLNEPLLNALYCGQYGYWPPYLRGHDGFVQLVRALARGVVLTQHGIAEVAPDATFVHVEASSRFVGDDGPDIEHLRHRGYLFGDLVTGRVGPDHPLAYYLAEHRFGDDTLAWLAEHPAVPDVMGVNYYPGVSSERVVQGSPLDGSPATPREKVDEGVEGLVGVLTGFAERYGRPVMLTETAGGRSPAAQAAWLDASVAACRDLRARGVDVVGYTWWAVIDWYGWDWRDGGALEDHPVPLGLWRLVPDGAGVLRRERTPLADAFRAHATGGR